ncbi:MAG: YncE family protein, partial [Candidatus Angelobacter sp.]
MQQRVFNTARFIFTVIIVGALLAGCGGGSSSSKNNNVVAQVTLAPASLSLEAGQVSDPLSVTAVNSSNNAVTTTFSFNSANPALATISPGGLVCAGVWDSTFVTCSGTSASGSPLSGITTITATAAGVTSAPVTISVHPHVTSVTVEPVAAGTCFSGEQTHQFVAHACSSAVTPPDTTGSCAPSSKEITDQIGAFTWSSSSPQVASVDANGLATANISGITGIVARVGNTSSPATNFRSCMPVSIRLHVPGDPAGQPTVSDTLNVADTKALEADITDENGKVVNNAPGISVLSNNTAVATVSGTTVTAQSPGGAGILAACLPPSCGSGLNQPVYGNLFSINVNGASPATTVYVASKDLAQVSTIIPIDTSQTPPVAGTQITLPGHPNSFIFDADGNKAYIGTDGGLVTLDPVANSVTLIAPEAVGTVLAVSPDGNHAIVSNAPNEPSNVLDHRLRFFDATNNTLQTFIIHNTVAAAFTPDGSKAY